MLQGEHSAILLTFIKLPFVIKIFVMSIFEWPFYTGFTVRFETNFFFQDLLVAYLKNRFSKYPFIEENDPDLQVKFKYLHNKHFFIG